MGNHYSYGLLFIILAGLILEAPFAPLHDEDCAGICPQCGADLNTDPCDCASVPDQTGRLLAVWAVTGVAGVAAVLIAQEAMRRRERSKARGSEGDEPNSKGAIR